MPGAVGHGLATTSALYVASHVPFIAEAAHNFGQANYLRAEWDDRRRAARGFSYGLTTGDGTIWAAPRKATRLATTPP